MNLFKRYINYLKDNPEGYWFKRKLYGWGWVPVTWEGWLSIAVFALLIGWSAAGIVSNPTPTNDELTWFFGKIVVSVVAIIFICYKKGEKPRWQRGLPDKDSA